MIQLVSQIQRWEKSFAKRDSTSAIALLIAIAD
jgi:hypothetical protein